MMTTTAHHRAAIASRSIQLFQNFSSRGSRHLLRSPNSTFAVVVVVVVVDTADSYLRASREAPVIRALRKCVVKLLKRCEFERNNTYVDLLDGIVYRLVMICSVLISSYFY